MPESGRVLISTFGGLRAVSDDRVIDKFATRNGRTMFARLVLSPRAILRSALSEILWPKDFVEATQERFRTELHRLKGLGPPISEILVATRESIDLDRSVLDVDVHIFERLLQQAGASDSVDERLHHLQQALAIADGEWLAHESDEWFSSERQRILVRQANAYIGASEAAQELSEPGLTLAYAQACVQLLPLYTDGVDRLIDVFEALGKISEAKFAYEAHSEIVRKRFGGPPDPRLQARIERIRSSDAQAIGKAVPSGEAVELPILPEGPPTVHGRDAEIARLCGWLSPAASEPKRLVSIIGPAGMGKTTVAQAACKKLASQFGGRVAFVELSAITNRADLLERVAETFFLHGAGDPLLRLRKSFGAQPLLLILDNVEQIPDAAVAVDLLLDYLPGSRIIATSRRPIRSNREQRLALQPLLTAEETSDDDVQPAVPLFLEHFRLRVPDYSPDRSAMEAIVKLVQRLNGHPLAIVLAASRGQVFSPEEMLAEVDRGLDWIRTDSAVSRPEHSELAAAFGSTLAQLGSQTSRHFQALSLFEGEWTMVDARNLCGPEVLDSVSELVDYSLARRLMGAGESRYSIALIFREFLMEEGHAATDSNLERLSNWFMGALREANGVQKTNFSEYMQRVDRIAPNFDTVFGWASGHLPNLASEILAQIWPYWYEGNKGARYVGLMSCWFSGNPAGEAKWIAEGTNGLARINFEIGNLEEALQDYERARRLFSELGDRRGEVSTLRTRMLVAQSQFNYAGVLKLSSEAIEMADEIEDEEASLALRLLRAVALANLGRGEESLSHLRKIIAQFELKGETVSALRARRSMSTVLMSLRRWAEADALLMELEGEFERIENSRDRAICWQNMVIISLRNNQFVEAARRFALSNEYARPIQTDYFAGNRNYLGSLLAVHDRQPVLALERAMYLLNSWYHPQAEIGVLSAVELVAFVLASFGDRQGARRLADGVAQARIRSGIEISPHFVSTQEELFRLISEVSPDPETPPFETIPALVADARRLAKASKSPLVASR